jgi:hypothetical protein
LPRNAQKLPKRLLLLLAMSKCFIPSGHSCPRMQVVRARGRSRQTLMVSARFGNIDVQRFATVVLELGWIRRTHRWPQSIDNGFLLSL